MSAILAYCDGACSGNPGPGGWGAVLILPEGRVRELGGCERSTTNNRMEMAGALAVLRATRDRPEPLKLFTDSGYLLRGITEWIAGWRRRGWITMDGGAVLNRDLWEALDPLAAARQGRLSWVHVKGHAGHEVNERCDAIAVAFSQGKPPALYDGPAVGCGYSLLDPPEQLRPAGRSSVRRSKPKGGYYLSMVGGRVERHSAWPDCQRRVHGVSGARFKRVFSAQEERDVLERWGAPPAA
ncbi:MAG: RNase H family protein [Elusimicrobiota bacterium]